MLVKDVQPVVFDEDAVRIVEPAERGSDMEVRAIRVCHSTTV